MTVETETPSAALVAEMRENFAAIKRSDREVDKLIAKRNQLWCKAVNAGMTPAEVGAVYALQGQSVRLAIKQLEAGTKLKARNARYRGLRGGGRKAAK